MLGITLHLGASKDQIIVTKTREVLFDRYAMRNRVKSVPYYKPIGNADQTQTKYPIGTEPVPAPDTVTLNMARQAIKQSLGY